MRLLAHKMDSKRCRKCNTLKFVYLFSLNRQSKYGLQGWCKQCHNANGKQWKNDNREHYNWYHKNLYRTNTNHRIKQKTRSRIHSALNTQNVQKTDSSQQLLGMDINLYKMWIEYQFLPGMTWENTHIDHVKPLSCFNLSDEGELYEAFNWINTQPLFKVDNLKKGNKYNENEYYYQFYKAHCFYHRLIQFNHSMVHSGPRLYTFSCHQTH